MKRGVWLLLCALLLLQTACSAVSDPRENMAQPVRFYYCFAQDDETYGGETGAMGWEWRDLGPEPMTASEILNLYLKGPQSQNLRSPFPADAVLDQAQVADGLLTVGLGEELLELTGVQRTLAAACLVYTMTQFADITGVQLTAGEATLSGVWGGVLKPESFLLEDDTATSDQTTVKLYFSDMAGRYLTEETRSCSDSEEALPEYILRQLLAGPQTQDARAVLPEGTKLLGVQITDGVCTVNFSEEFLRNGPKTHRLARLTVFAVVNSLTELPQVECVRFLCEGKAPGLYTALDLSQPLYREELAVGSAQKDAERLDATLYLPCGQLPGLVAVPLLVARTGDQRAEADVLDALLSFEPANGYENPFPEGTRVLDLSLEDGLCRVCFNSAFALCGEVPAQARQAVRSVVATLCALEDVEQVQITIQDGVLTAVDLSQPLSPQNGWIFE